MTFGPNFNTFPPNLGGNDPRGAVSLSDFYACMPQHKLIYVPNRELWPVESVNDRFPKVEVGVDGCGNKITLKPSVYLARNRPVEQLIWAPGEPMLVRDRLVNEGGWITHPGVVTFNLYLPPPLLTGGEPGKAVKWLEHVERIYPDDHEHVILWLAHRVQRPEEKINHALVLGGDQGIGKDAIIEPVKRAIGPWNFQEANPQQVLGQFNSFVKAIILRISEIRDLGDYNRNEFYNRMKSFTAAPPDVLRCDEKNIREYSVFNVCSVIETTNYRAGEGLYLPPDDRRHYVTWSPCKRTDFDKTYWDDLWGYYDRGGDRHVAAYLQNLDLSGFNPKAPPPRTEAFWATVNAYRPSEDAELADVLDEMGNPDIVTLRRVAAKASGDFAQWLNDRKNRRVIPHRFDAYGYRPVRNPDAESGLWVIRRRREVVYGRSDVPYSTLIARIKEGDFHSSSPHPQPKG